MVAHLFRVTLALVGRHSGVGLHAAFPNTCQAWDYMEPRLRGKQYRQAQSDQQNKGFLSGPLSEPETGRKQASRARRRRQGTDNTRPAVTNLPSDAVVRHGPTDQDAQIVPRPDTWSERNFSMPIRRPSDAGEFSVERLPRAEVVDCVVFIGLVWDIGQLIRPGLNNRPHQMLQVILVLSEVIG